MVAVRWLRRSAGPIVLPGHVQCAMARERLGIAYYACFQAMWVALGDPPLGRWQLTEIDEQDQVIRAEEESITLRWSYRQEMRYLFELCDFEVEAEYADFHESAPAYGKEQIWIVRKGTQG